MDFLFDANIWASFLTLSFLEIVLGIDNIIFIALVIQHLPAEDRRKARLIGLSLALIMRIIMLMGIGWVMEHQAPLFSVLDMHFSARDLLMLAGGLFLISKATTSLHEEITKQHDQDLRKFKGGMMSTIFQIIIIDLVFSFDSVATAIGLTNNIGIIIVAMTVAMFFMVFASSSIAHFIDKYPTLKILAIAFVLMIGFLLVIDAFSLKIPKAYLYFAMGFSLAVETINILTGRRTKKTTSAKRKK